MAFSLDIAVMGSVSMNKNNKPINKRAGKLEGRTVTATHQGLTFDKILSVIGRFFQVIEAIWQSGGVALPNIPPANRIDRNSNGEKQPEVTKKETFFKNPSV